MLFFLKPKSLRLERLIQRTESEIGRNKVLKLFHFQRKEKSKIAWLDRLVLEVYKKSTQALLNTVSFEKV